jgi:hypothetical protein
MTTNDVFGNQSFLGIFTRSGSLGQPGVPDPAPRRAPPRPVQGRSQEPEP